MEQSTTCVKLYIVKLHLQETLLIQTLIRLKSMAHANHFSSHIGYGIAIHMYIQLVKFNGGKVVELFVSSSLLYLMH